LKDGPVSEANANKTATILKENKAEICGVTGSNVGESRWTAKTSISKRQPITKSHTSELGLSFKLCAAKDC